MTIEVAAEIERRLKFGVYSDYREHRTDECFDAGSKENRLIKDNSQSWSLNI